MCELNGDVEFYIFHHAYTSHKEQEKEEGNTDDKIKICLNALPKHTEESK